MTEPFDIVQDCLNEAPDGQWIDIHRVIDDVGVNEANWIKKQDGKLKVLIITSEWNRFDKNIKFPKDFDPEEWWWWRLWIEWDIPQELVEDWWDWHDGEIINKEIISVYDLWPKLARLISNEGVIVFNENGEII